MPISTPPNFDPDSNDWSQGDRIEDVGSTASQQGWLSWRDVLYDLDDTQAIQHEKFRAGLYRNPQDAIYRMEDTGIIGFSFLWYNEQEDAWQIVVDY